MARITHLQSAVVKVEMRGHDNRIEFASFVPAASIPSIRELIALVSAFYFLPPSASAYFYSQRQPNRQKSTRWPFRLS